MTTQDIDRIQSAIDHIKTAVDVDEWAAEIAVNAMEKQIPQKPMISVDVYDCDLRSLYCPTCGMCIGIWNKRLRTVDMHNETNAHICAQCGQVINCNVERLEEE